MIGTIEVPRDLLLAALDLSTKARKELRDLLAAPVVERQPVAYVLTRDDEVCYEADDGVVISNTPGDETDLYKWKPVYFEVSPPAPVAVVLPERRVQPNGFTGKGWAELRGWNACLDKVKEMNP